MSVLTTNYFVCCLQVCAMDTAIKAIAICIKYWIQEENRIRNRLYISQHVENMSISRAYENLYPEMFKKINAYDLMNARKIRQQLVELAQKMVERQIMTTCDICQEHLMSFDNFVQGYDDPFIEDYDHRLFSYCNKCQVNSVQYF